MAAVALILLGTRRSSVLRSITPSYSHASPPDDACEFKYIIWFPFMDLPVGICAAGHACVVWWADRQIITRRAAGGCQVVS